MIQREFLTINGLGLTTLFDTFLSDDIILLLLQEKKLFNNNVRWFAGGGKDLNASYELKK